MSSYGVSLFLLKLSKQIAVLTILLILGRVYYQVQIGEATLLVLVIASALIHFWARNLRCRAIRNNLLPGQPR
jgi:hypothetical protein